MGPGQIAPGGHRRLSVQGGVFLAQVVALFNEGGLAYTRGYNRLRGQSAIPLTTCAEKSAPT
eukprot:12283058-Heterocapsa_arctica.AAC.1